MRSRATGILLAVLVAVAAYFFLVEEKNHKIRQRIEQEQKHLFPFEPKDVERFVLINPKGERIEIERSGARWTIVSPVTSVGDGPAIDSFIGQAVPGRRGEEIGGAANLADFGLEKPYATLILYLRGAEAPDTLFIGDKTPTSSSSYVRIGASRTVLIATTITHSFVNKSVLHFRDKNFLPFESGAVDALTIRTAGRVIRLVRAGRAWYLADRHARADSRTIEAYLSELTRAVIRQFVQENLSGLSRYGLTSPAREIVLGHGGETVRIVFGDTVEDEVYVVRTGLDKVLRIESKFLKAFDWTAASLRAMNLSFAAADSVEVVVYETPDTTLVLQRVGKKWGTTGADTLGIASDEVNALLWKLGSTRFERILTEPLPSADPRLARFALRVTLENAAGTVIDRITVASSTEGEIGGSLSADAIGALPKGTIAEIGAIFVRIGVNR
jgi:hypothetical protein